MYAVKRKEVGREPFQVAEVELGRCGLPQYGDGFCTAAGAPGSECYHTFDTCQDPENFDRLIATDFSDAAQKLSNPGGLDGTADTPAGTLAIAFYVSTDSHAAGQDPALIDHDTNMGGLRVYQDEDGRLFVEGRNKFHDIAFQARTVEPVDIGWHVLAASWDAAEERVQIWLDDVEVTDAESFDPSSTGTDVHYNGIPAPNDCTVGCGVFGGTFETPWPGCIAMVYIQPGTELDLSIEALRRVFFGRDGQPEFLGERGEYPTRSVAKVYLWGRPDLFVINRGDGGPFSGAAPVACAEESPWIALTKVKHRFCTSRVRVPAGTEPQVHYPAGLTPPEFPIVFYPAIDPRNGISAASTVIAPDRGLGQRASVTVQLRDFPLHDRFVDPYYATRGFDAETRLPFLARLIARNRTGFLGRQLRILDGYFGDPFTEDDFEARLYEVETVSDPDATGLVTIKAKDPLKRASESRAQAPRVSGGALFAAISAVDVAAQLKPAGIGDAEYKVAGFLRIESEVVSFTRVGDNLTLVRGQRNTMAAAHDASAAVQECLEYVGKRVHEVLADLLVNYANVPPRFIPFDEWAAEAEAFLPRLYSALITAPTAVDDLVKEINQQTPVYEWWDERRSSIPFRAIRPPEATARVITDTELVANTTGVDPDETLRVSQMWVYYGLINPTESTTEDRNYQLLYREIATDEESRPSYNQPVIDKVFARWISALNLQAAVDCAKRTLLRFRRTPRRYQFELDAAEDVWVGDVVFVLCRQVSDFAGLPAQVPVQIVEARPQKMGHTVRFSALEFYAQEQDGERVIPVQADYLDFNIRDAHDSLYGAPVGPVTVTVIVFAGIVLGASLTNGTAAGYAFRTGAAFPPGSTVKVIWKTGARVQGAGGKGGYGGGAFGGALPARNGYPGGDAMEITYPVTFEIEAGCMVWVGGGGGAGSQFSGDTVGDGGGGGAGSLGGDGGEKGGTSATFDSQPGAPGSLDAGGAAGNAGGGATDAGAGGAPGFAGGNATAAGGGHAGGAPGTNAIVGNAFITYVGEAFDIRGAVVP